MEISPIWSFEEFSEICRAGRVGKQVKGC